MADDAFQPPQSQPSSNEVVPLQDTELYNPHSGIQPDSASENVQEMAAGGAFLGESADKSLILSPPSHGSQSATPQNTTTTTTFYNVSFVNDLRVFCYYQRYIPADESTPQTVPLNLKHHESVGKPTQQPSRPTSHDCSLINRSRRSSSEPSSTTNSEAHSHCLPLEPLFTANRSLFDTIMEFYQTKSEAEREKAEKMMKEEHCILDKVEIQSTTFSEEMKFLLNLPKIDVMEELNKLLMSEELNELLGEDEED